MMIWHYSYIRKSEATLMKDEFSLADLKLEVYQEWVLLVKQNPSLIPGRLENW